MLRLQQHEDSYVERYVSEASHYREVLYKKFGVRYVNYREKWRQASKGELITEFPLHIDFDTIDACNLKCSHCQEENTRIRTKKKLSYELVDKIFREASNYDLCAVNIGTIGEPLLEKDLLFHILTHVEQAMVMETFLHTNGLMLYGDISEKLINSNLTYLFVSVDASNEQTYRKIRGGDFYKLKNNIKQFLNLRKKKNKIFPLLRLSFLTQQSNCLDKDTFVDVWSEFADLIDFQPLINYHEKREYGSIVSCFNSFLRILIGTSGEMGACCAGIAFNDDIKLGVFPEMSIYEAWNGKRINLLREAMLKQDLLKYPTCMDCLLRRERDSK